MLGVKGEMNMTGRVLACWRSQTQLTEMPDTPRVRVLVAEDDRKLARLLAQGLRESGMVVDAVHRGDDALEAGRSGDYDAIVLDVMMPGLDGFEVCRGLRTAACGRRCCC